MTKLEKFFAYLALSIVILLFTVLLGALLTAMVSSLAKSVACDWRLIPGDMCKPAWLER